MVSDTWYTLKSAAKAVAIFEGDHQRVTFHGALRARSDRFDQRHRDGHVAAFDGEHERRIGGACASLEKHGTDPLAARAHPFFTASPSAVTSPSGVGTAIRGFIARGESDG